MTIQRRLQAAWKAFNEPELTEDWHFQGIIRLRELPFETYEEYQHWWLPELAVRDGKFVLVRPARMTEREKDRYTVYEHKNILTQAGRTQILGFVGTPTYVSSQSAFAQQFAVGSQPITLVAAGDNAVAGEFARVVPSTAIPTGTQIDISMFFSTSAAVGTWTNVGLWGVNATSTLGSGTLMTHSLFNYVKDNLHTASADYLINLT